MNKSSLGLLASLAQMLISLFRMITKSAGVLENAVDMAHASVEVAAEEQTIELTIKRQDMRKRLVDQAALRTAKQEEIMQEYGSKSPQHKDMLDKIRTNLEENINKALLARKTE